MSQYSPTERIEILSKRLKEGLSPTVLTITDDSEHHIGHAGAQSGASHFSIEIASPLFSGKTRLVQHKMIYKLLGDLIPSEIHALKITILSS